MDIQTLAGFFMWCTILNAAILLFSTVVVLVLSKDFVYRAHSRIFPMQRETFNAAIYTLIGVYKIFIFVFNLIPWIALSIIR